MENDFLEDEPLPPGFTSLDKIWEYTSETIKLAPPFNVIAIVKDQQAPIVTKGSGMSLIQNKEIADCSDWKYTLEIVDSTIPMDKYGMKVNIFWPVHKMPKDLHVADVVLIRKVKVGQLHKSSLTTLLMIRLVGTGLSWNLVDRELHHRVSHSSIKYRAKIDSNTRLRQMDVISTDCKGHAYSR